MSRLLRAALLAALLPATGCGWAAAAIVLAVSGSGKSSSSSPPPTLQVTSSTARSDLPSAAAIPIAFRLIDASGAKVDVEAAWVASGSTAAQSATPAASSEALTGLAASADGVAHTFVWDAARDLGGRVGDVVLTLTPVRGGAAGVPVSVSLLAGQTPPRISIAALPATPTPSRNIATTITIQDDASDPVDVHLFVSAPGIPRHEVTLLGQARGVPTSPAGSTTAVVWDSSSSSALGFANVTATVEVDVVDRFGQTGVATSSFGVQNDDGPSVQILSVGTAGGVASVDGRIPIRFALFDSDADDDPNGPSGTPDVTVTFSLDNGSTFRPATNLGLQDGPRALGVGSTSGLRAHRFPTQVEGASGNVHTFLWDSLADGVGGGSQRTVLVTVTPSERVSGGATPPPGQGAAIRFVLGLPSGQYGADIAGTDTFTTPTDLIACDLDGDGRDDLVVVDNGGVAVSLATGSGNFAARTDYATTVGSPAHVAAADLDGDGLLDVVAVCQTDIVVFRGTGGGALGPASVSSNGANLNGFASTFVLGDLNRDGVPDLVAVGGPGGSPFTFDIGVALGDGAGGFSGLTTYATSLPASTAPALAVGDYDGDGALDVAVASQDGLSVLPGSLSVPGMLGFEVFSPIPTAVPNESGRLIAADFDRDGRLDLVFFQTNPAGNQVVVLRGSGDGRFTVAQTLPIATTSGVRYSVLSVADMDGDGRLDIVVGGPDASIWLGQSDGSLGAESFAPNPVRTPPYGSVIYVASVVADIDGDGASDLVWIDSDPKAPGPRRIHATLRLAGEGAFDQPIPIANSQAAVALGDLNGDGHVDLVQGITGGFGTQSILELRLARGGGAFGPAVTLATARDTGYMPGIGDVDGDGRLDLVAAVQTSNAVLSVRLGKGDGTFDAEQTYPGGPQLFQRIVLGDVDGDGRADVVHQDGGGVTIRRGLAGGALGPPIVLAGPAAQEIALGDFDGDGVVDIVTTAPQRMVFYRGLGGGAFAPSVTTILDAAVFLGGHISLADVDGDGRLDIALPRDVLLGAGGGALGARVPTSGGAGTAFAADIDGDGRVDTIGDGGETHATRSLRATRPFAVVSGSGDGATSGIQLVTHSYNAGGFSAAIGAVADLTEDGVPDVVLTPNGGGTSNALQVLVMAATRPSRAVPTLAAALPAGTMPRMLEASPLDIALIDTSRTVVPPGSRLVPCSLAYSFMPETSSLAAPSSITVTLHSTMTTGELGTSVLRVLRFEPEQGVRLDPRTGQYVHGRLVEVARRDPLGGALPAGVAAAVVDESARSVTFATSRLGRFQAFIEAPANDLAFVKETFDASSLDGDGTAAPPLGWVLAGAWECGAPPPGRVAAALVPAAASAPSVFAIGTRRRYALNATETAYTSSFTIPSAGIPSGRTVELRLLEFHDLAAGDSATLRILVSDFAGAGTVSQLLTTYSGPGGAAVLNLDAVDVTAAVNACIAAAKAGDPFPPGSLQASIELRLVTGAGPARRGWVLDDLALVEH